MIFPKPIPDLGIGFGLGGNMIQNKLNIAELVDIRDVSVDKALPKNERIAEFIRQIKNPYHFKCGKFSVKVKFAESGSTLEECLHRLVS